MVMFQTEENRKSLIYTSIVCAVLLLLFYVIKFNKQDPAKVLNLPEIVTITPDPPLPMPELKDNAGGSSNIPTPQPGRQDAGTPKPSPNPKSAPKESSPIKSSPQPDPHAAAAPASNQAAKPKVRMMGSTTATSGQGEDDFGNNNNSASNAAGNGGGTRGNGSPYGSGDDKTPGAFNNKLRGDLDFEGSVKVILKVGADGIPYELVRITKGAAQDPKLKKEIEEDIRRKLKNLRCKPNSTEYTEEFKLVYKKS